MIELIDLRDETPVDIIPFLTGEAYNVVTSEDGAGVAIYEDDKPAGAVVASIEDGAGVIIHIYIDPSYRRRGLGTELIYRLGLVLSGYESVYRMELSYENESENGLDPFFASLGFDIKEDEEVGEYFIKLSDAASSEILMKAKTDGVIPYNRLKSVVRNQLIMLSPGVSAFISQGMINEKMSCVMYDSDETDIVPDSRVFFGEKDDQLVLIWADSGERNMALISMLKFALLEAKADYDDETIIRLPYVTDVSKKIIEKLMGDKLQKSYEIKNAIYGLLDDEII